MVLGGGLSLEAAVLRTAGSGVWLSPKGRESSAPLGAPKFDNFVEFVASGYMASANHRPHQGSWPRSGFSLPRCATVVKMCGSPPPWHFRLGRERHRTSPWGASGETPKIANFSCSKSPSPNQRASSASLCPDARPAPSSIVAALALLFVTPGVDFEDPNPGLGESRVRIG